ncbi:MAG: hypothetical protein LBD57_04310 [Endomicrobium sp.]|jgi:hypothetical protein|uniref:hypothetical protein n=1 Tax=Candidatus Endomicrobiellum cubanum TaxID=3242325 RepID=UPI00281FDEF2|nr:hypothetical protein [Endomicrobium sp.]
MTKDVMYLLTMLVIACSFPMLTKLEACGLLGWQSNLFLIVAILVTVLHFGRQIKEFYTTCIIKKTENKNF